MLLFLSQQKYKDLFTMGSLIFAFNFGIQDKIPSGIDPTLDLDKINRSKD